jgi:hypothetical protein
MLRLKILWRAQRTPGIRCVGELEIEQTETMQSAFFVQKTLAAWMFLNLTRIWVSKIGLSVCQSLCPSVVCLSVCLSGLHLWGILHIWLFEDQLPLQTSSVKEAMSSGRFSVSLCLCLCLSQVFRVDGEGFKSSAPAFVWGPGPYISSRENGERNRVSYQVNLLG